MSFRWSVVVRLAGSFFSVSSLFTYKKRPPSQPLSDRRDAPSCVLTSSPCKNRQRNYRVYFGNSTGSFGSYGNNYSADFSHLSIYYQIFFSKFAIFILPGFCWRDILCSVKHFLLLFIGKNEVICHFLCHLAGCCTNVKSHLADIHGMSAKNSFHNYQNQKEFLTVWGSAPNTLNRH